MITYLSKGGVSYGDLDELSPYDRSLILNTLIELKENERKSLEESLSNN